jgi:hypothetical protein
VIDESTSEQFPALQGRILRGVDTTTEQIDEARRVLWRAFQHGILSEDEFARTLDRLEFGGLRQLTQGDRQ